MNRKKLCFIAQKSKTCDFIAGKLKQFFCDHLTISTWALETGVQTTECSSECDMYLVTPPVLKTSAALSLPKDKPQLVIARTLNTSKLGLLFGISPGTKALLVQTNETVATDSINLLKSFGFDYINFTPYYPGGSVADKEIKTVITTGFSHLMPANMDKVIDLGLNDIDLSTYAEIINYFGLPRNILDVISHKYIEDLLALTMKYHHATRNNENIKRRMEVLINTVNEAIVAIDENGEILTVNSAAQRLLTPLRESLSSQHSYDIFGVINQIGLKDCLETGLTVTNEIFKINSIDCLVTSNLIIDKNGHSIGAVATLRAVTDVQEMEHKVRRELKQKGHLAKYTFDSIFGEDPGLLAQIRLARRFAKTELNVLLEGASGTGKELFAQAIHSSSPRKSGPFVAINLAAFPEDLVESELFGFEEGTFTGAKKGGKKGLFEEAHTGTIFLDEIGDASLDIQKKLLRVLEEKEVRRVGSSSNTPIDVRVIAATNQDLELLVKKGEFRGDLFYRLCVVPIRMLPLRNRPDDILPMFDYFARKNNNRTLLMDHELQEFLRKYEWPGNIRQLINTVNYMCNVVTPLCMAGLSDLPAYLSSKEVFSNYLDIADVSLSNMELRLIKNDLNKRRILEPVIILLQQFLQPEKLRKGIGRRTLFKNISESREPLSEYKLRELLKKLKELKCIESGITRQGHNLTEKGKALLSYLVGEAENDLNIVTTSKNSCSFSK